MRPNFSREEALQRVKNQMDPQEFLIFEKLLERMKFPPSSNVRWALALPQEEKDVLLSIFFDMLPDISRQMNFAWDVMEELISSELGKKN